MLQPCSFCSRVLWLLSCLCLCVNFKTGFHISVKNVVGILTTYQFALECWDDIHAKKQLGKKGFVSVSSLQSIITEGQSQNSRQKSEGGTKADSWRSTTYWLALHDLLSYIARGPPAQRHCHPWWTGTS